MASSVSHGTVMDAMSTEHSPFRAPSGVAIAKPATSTRGNGWPFAPLAASMLVLLTSAFWLTQGVIQPDPKDKDAKPNETQEYFHTLRGDLLAQKGFELFGTNADELVKFAPTGMRLDLPPGPREVGGRPNMGLSIPMTVKGDFEITVNFELLKEPEPQDAGDMGTRFSLGIFKQTPKACVATISRSVNITQGSLFVSWWHLWTTEEKQPAPRAFTSPTKIKSGRLRLVRTGSMLTYLVGDGEKEPHVIKTNENFGNENLRLVRLSAATGSERAALDVRLTDLRVRSGFRPVINSPDGKVIAKKPFQHIEILFNKGLNQHNLSLVGRDAESMAKADAQGLRVNVPAERGDHGLVGVEAKYRLRGDFDVTLAYELLGLPEPAPPLGAGVQLWIHLENKKGANVTRMQKPAGGTFGANKIDPGPDGKDLFTGFINVPANAKSGQLRLTRTGTKLIYQVADGDAAFAQPKIIDFDTGDVVTVRAVCNTAWAAFPVDVRLIRMDLKAEQIPNDPNRATADAEELVGRESGERGWLIGVALAACGLSGVFVLGISILILMRLRRAKKSPADDARDAPAVAPTISFLCSECNNKLRVKADATGKKIKCPHCGATTAALAADTERK